MKHTEIQVGGVYFDGKQGVRRVLDEGAPLTEGRASLETDCIRYEALGPAMDGMRKVCSRESLATWAQVEVPPAAVEALLTVLHARHLRLRPDESELLLRLNAAQHGQPRAQSLQRRETRAARSLKVKGAIFLIEPSGLSPGLMARLSPLGEQVVHRLKGHALPLPSPLEMIPTCIPAAPAAPVRPRSRTPGHP
jgi:hypothetical protein